MEYRAALGIGGARAKETKTMATIAVNTSRLPIPDKLIKGNEIITKSTANPDVPGNAALVTSLTAAQAALVATNAAAEGNRLAGVQLTKARDAALGTWNAAVVALAGFTESATDGDAVKILTTGYTVRAEAAAPQPVAPVINVHVSYTGMPGYSEVRWKRESNADAYVVQRSPEPITEASWVNVGTVTEAKFEGNGVTPGQKYWYRVAGVNRLGQGPWSDPALRPVM